jgi:hypothetical protein
MNLQKLEQWKLTRETKILGGNPQICLP